MKLGLEVRPDTMQPQPETMTAEQLHDYTSQVRIRVAARVKRIVKKARRAA